QPPYPRSGQYPPPGQYPPQGVPYERPQYSQPQPQYPQPQYQQPQWRQGPQGGPRSTKQWSTALILFIVLGQLSAHRFYAGKIGTAILQIITLGGLGIWLLIDFILLVTGNFTDSNGIPLNRAPIAGGNKSWVATVFLCAFLGTLGIHRFYVGKIGTGI